MALAFDVNIVVVEATHSTAQKTLRIEFAFGNTPTLVNTPPKMERSDREAFFTFRNRLRVRFSG
jgi:hypothetical protein